MFKLKTKQSYVKQFYTLYSILFILLVATTTANAQSLSKEKQKQQAKAEKELVAYLNKLCKEYTRNEMPVELGNTIAPFRIVNKTLLLNRMFYTEDSISIQRGYSLPVSNILDVFFDYYIGFEGQNEHAVTVTETEKNKPGENKRSTMLLLHIAPVGDGEYSEEIQTKLRKLVKAVQDSYKQ